MSRPFRLGFSVHRPRSAGQSLAKILSASHQIGADLLRADLELAGTFLDMAQTSRNQETMRRNQQNARQAYEFVRGFLLKLKLEEAERQFLNGKLQLLKQRLEQVGQTFEG